MLLPFAVFRPQHMRPMRLPGVETMYSWAYAKFRSFSKWPAKLVHVLACNAVMPGDDSRNASASANPHASNRTAKAGPPSHLGRRMQRSTSATR